jgi:hypothetical protein
MTKITENNIECWAIEELKNFKWNRAKIIKQGYYRAKQFFEAALNHCIANNLI